jgi:hypothetical protein
MVDASDVFSQLFQLVRPSSSITQSISSALYSHKESLQTPMLFLHRGESKLDRLKNGSPHQGVALLTYTGQAYHSIVFNYAVSRLGRALTERAYKHYRQLIGRSRVRVSSAALMPP